MTVRVMSAAFLIMANVNLTADHNSERCHAGYDKGWDTTCKEAFENPNAGHDIYGCPGISDAAISHQLKIDAIKANQTGRSEVCVWFNQKIVNEPCTLSNRFRRVESIRTSIVNTSFSRQELTKRGMKNQMVEP
jgi:hypothetical protein